MKRRLSQRAYLNGDQRRLAARLFGSCRFVYNAYLYEATRQYNENGRTDFALVEKTVLTAAKRVPETAWLAELPAVPLQQSAQHARRAYMDYFKSLRGERKGAKLGKPKFKKKRKSRDAASFTKAAAFRIRVDGCSKWGFVRLPQFGEIKFRVSQDIDWNSVSSLTLIGDPDGSYSLSFVYEYTLDKDPAPEGSVAGIDLGLKSLAYVVHVDEHDNVSTFSEPQRKHFRRAQRKLRRAQKSLSRKQEGSRNYEKQRREVARIHADVAARRKDQLDKFTHKVSRETQTVALETLSLKGMGRTRLAKAVYDSGLGSLCRMLEYKTADRGGQVIRVGRWTPTTQPCSVCGHKGIGKLPLSVREWTCVGCGTELHRDYNAALNILFAAGLAATLKDCGASVRRISVAGRNRQGSSYPPNLATIGGRA